MIIVIAVISAITSLNTNYDNTNRTNQPTSNDNQPNQTDLTEPTNQPDQTNQPTDSSEILFIEIIKGFVATHDKQKQAIDTCNADLILQAIKLQQETDQLILTADYPFESDNFKDIMILQTTSYNNTKAYDNKCLSL